MTIKVSTAKPMGHNQRQYAIRRIDELERIKGEEIEAKFPLPHLTYGDIAKMGKAGKLPVKKHLDMKETCTNYMDGVSVSFNDVFDTAEVEDAHKASAPYKSAAKAQDAAKQKLADRCRRGSRRNASDECVRQTPP